MPARKKVARKTARKSRVVRKKVARKVTRKAAKPAARKPAAPKAPPAPPNAIGLSNMHMDFSTNQVQALKRFYTELLGFKQFEHDPQMDYLYVQTGTMASLGFMPPFPGQLEVPPPKEANIYLIVKDVDSAYADLTARGVVFEGPPADMPWGHRVARTRDPEGRSVMLATVKASR